MFYLQFRSRRSCVVQESVSSRGRVRVAASSREQRGRRECRVETSRARALFKFKRSSPADARGSSNRRKTRAARTSRRIPERATAAARRLSEDAGVLALRRRQGASLHRRYLRGRAEHDGARVGVVVRVSVQRSRRRQYGTVSCTWRGRSERRRPTVATSRIGGVGGRGPRRHHLRGRC